MDGYTLSKWTELRIRLDECHTDIDIIVLSGVESNKAQNDILQTYDIPGFRYITNISGDKEESGICFYISKRIKCQLIEINSVAQSIQNISLCILENGDYFGCLCNSTESVFESIIRLFVDHKVFLVGNITALSVLHLDKLNFKILSCDRTSDVQIMCQTSNIGYTSNTEHAGLGNSPNALHEIEYLQCAIPRDARQSTVIHHFDRVDIDKIIAPLRLNSFHHISIEHALAIIYKHIYYPYLHAVHKEETIQKVSPLWINKTIVDICMKKLQVWSRFEDDQMCSERYNLYTDNLEYKILKAKVCFEGSLLGKINDGLSLNADYSLVKPEDETVESLRTSDGSPIITDMAIAEEFSTHFQNVFVPEDAYLYFAPQSSPRTIDLDKLVITTDNILHAIEDSNTPGPGPDGIKVDVVKHIAPYLLIPLRIIFNRCLNEVNSIPQKWKLAKVRAKHKKESKHKTDNYRPLSITSYICKLLERIIVDYIDGSFVHGNVLSKRQHGYKGIRCSTTNLLECIDVCTTAIRRGDPVDIVYMDLAKAYDTVPHRKLIMILEEIGLPPQLVSWIKDFLTDRKQYVSVKKCKSTTRDVISGVPQGSTISNLLFIIFVNNLPELVRSHIFMYCDDIKLVSVLTRGRNGQYVSDNLQEDVFALNKWATNMKMKFSPRKCKIMHLGDYNPRNTYYIRDSFGVRSPVEETTLHIDLGIRVDDKLSFSEHCQYVADEAMKRVKTMKLKFSYLHSDVFYHLYCQYIRSKLEYATCVYSPSSASDQDLLENVQREAVMSIDNLNHLNYSERLKHIQLPTLLHRRKRADLVQFFRYYRNTENLDRHFDAFKCNRVGEVPDNECNYHSCAVKVETSCCEPRQNFFFLRAARWWNELSEETVSAPNVEIFTALLDVELKNDNIYEYRFST